ncbi:MAG: acyl carrier protein [Chitinispirillaceae bacterium]|nr:acyl carrier protein [Chitinispirillaceae bacterium]
MAPETIYSRLSEILAKDFQINVASIEPDTPIFNQLSLDSMQLVAIIAKVEQEFGIELPLSLIEEPTLNSFISIVAEAMVKKNPQP